MCVHIRIYVLHCSAFGHVGILISSACLSPPIAGIVSHFHSVHSSQYKSVVFPNHCGALWVPIPRLFVVLLSSSIDAASAMCNYSTFQYLSCIQLLW